MSPKTARRNLKLDSSERSVDKKESGSELFTKNIFHLGIPWLSSG